MTVIGTLIGHRFRLEERIGSGGMSSVYRAFDPTLERQVAIRLRHPRRVLLLSVLLLAIVAGGVAYLATSRTEKGAGSPVTPSTPGLSNVQLAGNAATDYDPEGDGGESPDETQLAIDGNRTTVWDTERYLGGFEGSDKRGVGLYVDADNEVA